ncbi:cyclic peptide export ABC transporter [Massilia aurea]
MSQILLLQVANAVSSELRERLFRAVAGTSVERLERVGVVRVNMALTMDVGRIVVGARTAPDLLIHSISVFGVLSFLFFVNTDLLIFILLIILIGGLSYRVPIYIGSLYLKQARKVQEQQGEATSALILGAKELKINDAKRRHFFKNVLVRNEKCAASLEIRGASITRAGISYGDLVSVGTIGIVSFIFVNYRTISQNELTGVIMGLLYLVGPIAAILSSAPQISLARISQRRVDSLLRELPIEPEDISPKEVEAWKCMRICGATYQHAASESARSFSVGPIDLELHRGQVTMLIGGNGSGKSTIGKLISMHYLPITGTLRFDDVAVSTELVSSYRQEISAIFPSYYLFDHLFGLAEYNQTLIDKYLSLLKLEGKVSIENGRFSTLNLSDGQRRRLALLATFLEDRSLYVFDEWAADQDPEFKHFFYQELLQDLRNANKAIVVITHDDRYFYIADQLVFIENGQITHMEHRTRLPNDVPH